jgi:glycosyltransferase involved in cell wall biosynthesis
MVGVCRRRALIPPPVDSSRLRVLVMPEWYPWPDRPMEGAFCREQARAVARAHDVIVIAWRAEERMARPFSIDRAQEEGVTTYRIRFRRSGVPRLSFLTEMLGILTVVIRLRVRGAWIPDVVHAHEFGAGLAAIAVAAMSRAPVVVTEHSSAIALGRLQPRQKMVARRAFSHADVVCPVSEDLGHRLAELVDGTPIVPVPNTVDDELFRLRLASARPASPDRSEVKLLTVGSLVEIKGHRHLIQAMAQLRAAGVPAKLDVVGDGLLRRELQTQAHELGVHPHVEFHGVLSRACVAAMMGTADIFVLPSLWETQGCALIEAMTCGCPSVATDVGGVPEVLNSGAGVLVAPGSSDALVGGIVEVLDRLADYRPQELRSLAVDRYGYTAISRRWSAVYRSALAKRSPARVS